NANPIPVEVQNRIALVKGSGTFAQLANSVAPLNPIAIAIITSVENATALTVVNGIATFTIDPNDANYLLGVMLAGVSAANITNGTISQLPLRVADSANLANFEPGMA